MRNDYGEKWKTKDYLMALIVIFLIIIAILIPVGIYAGALYVFGEEHNIIIFGVMFGLLIGWNIWIILKK